MFSLTHAPTTRSIPHPAWRRRACTYGCGTHGSARTHARTVVRAHAQQRLEHRLCFSPPHPTPTPPPLSTQARTIVRGQRHARVQQRLEHRLAHARLHVVVGIPKAHAHAVHERGGAVAHGPVVGSTRGGRGGGVAGCRAACRRWREGGGQLCLARWDRLRCALWRDMHTALVLVSVAAAQQHLHLRACQPRHAPSMRNTRHESSWCTYSSSPRSLIQQQRVVLISAAAQHSHTHAPRKRTQHARHQACEQRGQQLVHVRLQPQVLVQEQRVRQPQQDQQAVRGAQGCVDLVPDELDKVGGERVQALGGGVKGGRAGGRAGA